jgi:hypothetical protein
VQNLNVAHYSNISKSANIKLGILAIQKNFDMRPGFITNYWNTLENK